MSTHAPRLRSLYRAILRELPPPQQSSMESFRRSPLHHRIRNAFSAAQTAPASGSDEEKKIRTKVEEAEQFLKYARAQRMYATLLERYNPGMGMDEEERVRLSARRVGMNLPIEHQK
ncbi:MAG: hypothetical protein M1819_005624 [Sarea resinae]|nr:MAG: hypothetical protein M1819_005624 [Sarea resinae]